MKQPDETAGAGTIAPIQLIKVAAIRPDPNNRKEHDKAKLATFAEEIRVDGLLNAIVVRKLLLTEIDSSSPIDYQLIAGERRWLAHQILKRDTIEARVLTGEVAKTSTRKRVAENFHREDLTPIEKARDLKQLEVDGLSQSEIAAFVGAKDQSTVSNFLRLLALPKKVQDWLQDGSLNAAHGKALVKYAQWPAACEAMAQVIIDEGLSSKAVEAGEMIDAIDNKLVVAVDLWRFPGNKLPAALVADSDFLKDDNGWLCFGPGKLRKALAVLDSEKRVEQARERERVAAAPTTAAGEVIEPGFEALAALIPNNKLGKQKLGGKTVLRCLDSALWKKITAAHKEITMEDRKAKLPALLDRAWDALKAIKTVGAREISLLFFNSQYGEEVSTGDLGSKFAQRLGLPFAKRKNELSRGAGYYSRWVIPALAKCDAAQLLKLRLGKILDEIADTAAGEFDSDNTDFLQVLLGVPELGFLEESEQGRKDLVALTGKKLGIKTETERVAGSIREMLNAGYDAQQISNVLEVPVEMIRKLGGPAASKPAAVKKPGNKPVAKRATITDETYALVKKMVFEGHTGAEIAKKLGISLPSVQNCKKRLGLVKAAAAQRKAAK